MGRRDTKINSFRDVSSQAQSTLDYVISGAEEKKKVEESLQMPISQALADEEVLAFDSGRAKSRVLFITSDPGVLDEDSSLQQQIREIHSVFAEVHIAVLMRGKKREYPTKRIEDCMWVYTVNFSSPLFLTQVIHDFAESQLQFGDGFRPDVVVALDPYYAALAAETLSKQYDRPLQIHVLEDFMDPGFVAEAKDSKEKIKIARRVLRRAKSVRTNSSLIKGKLASSFKRIEDLGMLPRHFNIDPLLKAKRTDFVKKKYPQYVFMIVTAATLDQNNTVFRTMDAARSMLFSPGIGMAVIGEGSMRAELQQRAQILGVKEQVVFETNISTLHQYLLSANMFVCTDTTSAGDEYVIQAAAAGLPIVMARTPLREDLFVDGESGLFCDAEDVIGFNQKMNTILNTNAYRLQFGMSARDVIKERLHTDPELYKAAYRDSIEVVFGNAEVPRAQATNVDEVEDEVRDDIEDEDEFTEEQVTSEEAESNSIDEVDSETVRAEPQPAQ